MIPTLFKLLVKGSRNDKELKSTEA